MPGKKASTPAKKQSTAKTVYQLRVVLNDIEPAIWRRMLVPADTLLPDLHLMLQAAMGWFNCHLHSFTFDGVEYTTIDPDFDDVRGEDEAQVRLNNVAPRAGIYFGYVYDFGDYWEHDVLIEEIKPAERGREYPYCLDGARACPPEDVGSTMGYEEFLEAIRDPKHEGHESMLGWVGGSFDPEAFDVDQVNGQLADYRLMDAEYSG